jgi:hypothetical protein
MTIIARQVRLLADRDLGQPVKLPPESGSSPQLRSARSTIRQDVVT